MDQAFLIINSWMGQGLLLGALGCFLWGMVSVLFSPCHIASIPLIIGYVAKTLVATLDWNMDMQAAISLPNFGSRNGPTEVERGTEYESLIGALKATTVPWIRESLKTRTASRRGFMGREPTGAVRGHRR